MTFNKSAEFGLKGVKLQDQQTLIDWLTLFLAPGLGSHRLQQLRQTYSQPATALAAIRAGECKMPATAEKWLKSPDESRIDAHLNWVEQPHHHILINGENNYPELLSRIDSAPTLLFVVGNPEYLWQPQIAMVGSRNPSHVGLLQAHEMASQLAADGLVVTSGLAMGIDTAAHKAALEQNRPTVAILGTGVDRVYPARNKGLARRIAEQGALVSEFSLTTEPRAGHFPARNRIISGLSLATLVIEAGLRSGSLITARLAAEQGREIMAMPGSVRNANSRGCHALIRDGARLVENAGQVMQEVASLAGQLAIELSQSQVSLTTDNVTAIEALTNGRNKSNTETEYDAEYQQLLQALGGDPLSLDELVEATDLTPEVISSMLLMLELRGQVVAEAGGNWTRIHEVG